MSDLADKADKGVEKEVMETGVEDANLETSKPEISQHCTVSTMEDREERNLVGIQPLNIKFEEMIEDEMTAASSTFLFPVSPRKVRFGEVIVLPAKDAIIDTSEQAQVLSLADEAIPTNVESSEASEIEELEDQYSEDDAPDPSESQVIEAIAKTEEMEKDPLLQEEMTNELEEATLSFDGFWEGMIAEWEKRLAVMESLREMKNKIRFNDSQCCHLIETYSTMEFLTQQPAEYLEIPSSGASDITRWLRSSLDTFMELTRIMQHGEVLVRDCTHEDWMRSALTRMTVVPKKPEWKVVTSFSLHLQRFKWILHLIGITVLNLVCISQNDPSANLKEEFQNQLQTFSIVLPNSYTEMEECDRQIFLDRLAEYVETQSSVEVESSTDQQLAQFMQWRLHGRDPTNANISQSRGFSRNMVFNEELGKGAYGIVNKETWLGVEVAVKEMSSEVDFKKETECACLQHPHIVPVLDYWHGNKYTLVMELMQTDLCSHIRKLESKLSISRAIDLMMQLAEPMKYLRECKVLHRDLKASNIMVSPCKCGDHECVTLKLADFGTSKYKPEASLYTTQNQGTRAWMAPEVWGIEGLKEKYTMAADVYSFGITCSEILTGEVPFDGIPRGQLRKKVVNGLRPELPESCPAVLSAYIYRCWATIPSERPQHFFEVCEFLQFCKAMLLRNGLPSELSSANEDDARMLLTHLGLQWCLQKDANGRRISEDVYEQVVMLASREGKWLEVANLEDRPSIQLELANYLGNWTGAERHYETAIQVLQSLEDVRYPEAIWRLGYCFELGLGVTQDFEQAALLYESAIKLDRQFWNAYVELGRCYAMGRGVARSIGLATGYWEYALKFNHFSIIKSIEEQLVILVARDEGETGRLKASTVCRERAAVRLLDMTVTNSGRKLLAGALVDIIKQYRTELDSMDAEEPLQTNTSPELLELEGAPPLDDQGENPTLFTRQDGKKQKEHSVERSLEEKAVLEEILQFMCKEDKVFLKNIFRDLIPEEENAEEESPKEDLEFMLDEFVTSSVSNLKHHRTFSPLPFFIASVLVWMMLSSFYPRSHISVFSVFPRLPLSPPWKAAFCSKFLDSHF